MGMAEEVNEDVLQQAGEMETTLPKHILVVDDSSVARNQIKRVLEKAGIECTLANDGQEGLDVLTGWVDEGINLNEKIALVISDVEMPRMDGYELATTMRNDTRLNKVPIIMITSRTGDKHRQRALDIGVNMYMGKPYQEQELIENIRALTGVEQD